MQKNSGLLFLFGSFIFLILSIFAFYDYVLLILFLVSIVTVILLYLLFVKDKFKELKSLDGISSGIKDSIIDFSTKQIKLDSDISFNDIKGLDYVRDELKEVIDFLKNPSKYKRFKIRLPKGILLVGPPGVGKTMIAKALANYIEIPFYYESGSSFAHIYVGSGSKKVREIFNQAKRNSPCIIFIDEIDAIGKSRGGNRNDERESTLNELLTQMDGFINSDGVVVIGATNKVEMLDDALLRAGRFDKRVFVNLPTTKDREEIIAYHLMDIPNNVDVSAVAKMTAGANSATISTLINEAGLDALKREAKKLEINDFYSVRDKVFLGKKSKLILSDDDKNIVSIYQAAKALGLYIFSGEITKVSLFNEWDIKDNRALMSKSDLASNLKVHLSGMVGLDIVFNNQFSYAKSDIDIAKKIARSMVYDYAMGERMIGDDSSVNAILENQTDKTRDSLLPHKESIEKIATKLILKEEFTILNMQKMIDEIF
jgi:ATP-dependent metalloprotease FtsH